jgi:hypothetical protein
MLGSYVILGGIVLFAGTITILDWLARRKDKRASSR